MLPPPLAAIAHGKLSSRVYSKFSSVGTNSFSRYAVARLRLTRPLSSTPPLLPSAVFLLFDANEALLPCLRNLDTKLRRPYCYRFRSDNRLESVANAHTAADLHVRPVSKTALV